jgi:hypothetical protein
VASAQGHLEREGSVVPCAAPRRAESEAWRGEAVDGPQPAHKAALGQGAPATPALSCRDRAAVSPLGLSCWLARGEGRHATGGTLGGQSPAGNHSSGMCSLAGRCTATDQAARSRAGCRPSRMLAIVHDPGPPLRLPSKVAAARAPGGATVSGGRSNTSSPGVVTWPALATAARGSRVGPRAGPSGAASRINAPPARDGAAGQPAYRSSSSSAPAPRA